MDSTVEYTKAELIEKLETALKKDNIEEIFSTFKEVKANFQQLSENERKEQQDYYNKNAEEGEKFEFKPNPLDEKYRELAKIYKEKRSVYKKELAAKQEENYQKKLELIKKLDELVNGSLDNIGASFQKFYEIRDEWQATGDVNQARFKQLQYDYSVLVDLFYYNIGIHKELQNYDLKKNGEEKKSIIEKLKSLSEIESIRQLEHFIKQYQNEWDNIGPTEQETWEKLKEEYWSLVNGIYEKIKIHYQKIREKQKEALEKKEQLSSQLSQIIEKIPEISDIKNWNKFTKEVIETQKEWRNAGYSKKANEQELYEQFKASGNLFFEKKSAFFDQLKSKQGDIAQQKKELIEKAKNLKDSKQWRETSEQLIRIQKQWKKLGNAHPKIDQKLWNEFRTYCDAFFTAKKEYYDTLDDRKEENTKSKESILDSLKKNKSVEEIIDSAKKWYSIGVVSKNKMKSLEQSFEKEMKTLASKFDKENIEAELFKAKIEALKQKENAQELLLSEKKYIKSQIDKISDELNQYENNMSFFGHSKGAQKLKEVVEEKMETAQSKMEEWKGKLKMLK